MVKKSPELRISEIEENYPNQWVVVDITKKDKYGFPASGKVLLQGNSMDFILEKIESFQGDLYTFYTGSIDGEVE